MLRWGTDEYFVISLIIFKINLVRKYDFPHSEGPVMIQRSRCDRYRSLSFYLLVTKVFIGRI